jgi:hypothetical protein
MNKAEVDFLLLSYKRRSQPSEEVQYFANQS